MQRDHIYNISRLTKFMLLSLFMLAVPARSYGGDASFSWTANTEPSVVGYKLYYKEGTDNTASYNGTGLTDAEGQTADSPILIGGADTTSYTISGLSPDKSYQFVLTAYDDNLESDYSSVATAYSDPSPTIISIIKVPEE